MRIEVQTFTVHKRFPLTISRGTTAQTTNVWLRVEHAGIEGWGEASPFSVGELPQTTEGIVQALQQVAPLLATLSPLDRQQIELKLQELQLPSAARTAIEIALQDWLGKRAGLPLWQLWGLDRSRVLPTSVTIGINPPEVARQRVRDWLQLTEVKAFKVKLGLPDGFLADQEFLRAVLAEIPPATQVLVDANGAWTVEVAIKMCEWLAELGVIYVEQPLPRGQEAGLVELYGRSPLPIFVDESCFTSQDIVRLADRVHGINIKLMKSGGLAEALRMIHTARACGLQVML
ncbi:MAG: dipeptide epimerase, partial [Leptolyngbyaceae bacterium]|nr:dipeptide epimerase [Leptolyngbyaceae bacterium]